MKIYKFQNIWQLLLIVLTSSFSFTLTSCGEDDAATPKPRAYFRLAFPEKKYVQYNEDCPFTFEIPAYSKMENDNNNNAEPCWLNLKFPTFNGTLHLSYKEVKDNINTYMQDTYTLASKHQIKASGIEEMARMEPQPRSTIDGNTCCVASDRLRTLTAWMASKSSALVSKGPPTLPTPTL